MTPLWFAVALAQSPDVVAVIRQDPQAAATAACQRLTQLTVARDGTPFRKLNELPPGLVEHAVLRTVDGCPVREVHYDNQTYYLYPAIGRLEKGPDVGSRMRRYPSAR